jgi:hypothetical protein
MKLCAGRNLDEYILMHADQKTLLIVHSVKVPGGFVRTVFLMYQM